MCPGPAWLPPRGPNPALHAAHTTLSPTPRNQDELTLTEAKEQACHHRGRPASVPHRRAAWGPMSPHEPRAKVTRLGRWPFVTPS